MSKKSFLIGALIGGILAGIAALLLAPKSGKLLRRDVCDKCKETKQKAGKIVSTVCQQTSDLVEKAKDFANEAKDTAASILNELKDRR